jgi:hypothetical protein
MELDEGSGKYRLTPEMIWSNTEIDQKYLSFFRFPELRQLSEVTNFFFLLPEASKGSAASLINHRG